MPTATQWSLPLIERFSWEGTAEGIHKLHIACPDDTTKATHYFKLKGKKQVGKKRALKYCTAVHTCNGVEQRYLTYSNAEKLSSSESVFVANY